MFVVISAGIHSITREEAIIRFDLRDPLTAQSCVCKEAGSGAENKANHTATSQTTTSQTTTSKSVKEKPVSDKPLTKESIGIPIDSLH